MTIGVQQRRVAWGPVLGRKRAVLGLGPVPSTRAETALIRACQEGTRTERCACGGEISAPGHDWRAIAAAVVVHNVSTQHQHWRAGR